MVTPISAFRSASGTLVSGFVRPVHDGFEPVLLVKPDGADARPARLIYYDPHPDILQAQLKAAHCARVVAGSLDAPDDLAEAVPA